MTRHKANLETNPWVLLAAFVVLAGLLFGVLRVASASGGDDHATDAAATTGLTATSSSSASPSSAPPAPPTTPAPLKPRTVSPAVLRQRLMARLRAQARAKVLASRLTTTGPLGTVTAPKGGPVSGTITTSVANIPNTRADRAWYGSVHALIAPAPDFVTLNEVYKHPTSGIEAAAPGYTCYRVEEPDHDFGGAGPSMNNVVCWRSDRWEQVAGGRYKVVNDDNGYLRGKPFVWDRYAMWSILRRKSDGAIVSLASLHMPTNPVIYPQQHGHPGMSRVRKYDLGMNAVIGMVDQLEHYGPVLVGGDMNSHPSQGPWTAAAHFGRAGYTYAKDTGVMYLFYRSPASVVAKRQIHIVSDHPAIITTLAMNGSGPS